jgi:hypothetical protein
MSDPQIPPDGKIRRPVHPCPAQQRTDERDIERISSMPYFDRDPDDRNHWLARHLQCKGLTLTGDVLDKSNTFNGMQMFGVHNEVRYKLTSLANQLSSYIFNARNALSMTIVLELLVRWFIQHPPALDWMEGYVARWLRDHPRGKPRMRQEVTYEEVVRAGFDSLDEFERAVDVSLRNRRRELLREMEERDLTHAEICPEIEKMWIMNGSLKLPKKVKEMLDAKPPDEET